jgi:hypothetical protein
LADFSNELKDLNILVVQNRAFPVCGSKRGGKVNAEMPQMAGIGSDLSKEWRNVWNIRAGRSDVRIRELKAIKRI